MYTKYKIVIMNSKLLICWFSKKQKRRTFLSA